ncbi:hypothetical protein Tco_1156024 [Tanacetum coccineum]
MSTSYIYILSDSEDESIGSSVSCIILSDSEEVEYEPVSDDDTELLEALALLDYSLGSNTESEPSKVDPKESAEEDPIEEDPFEEDPQEADEPPSALAVPTSPTRPALLVRPGQEIPFVAHTEYALTGYLLNGVVAVNNVIDDVVMQEEVLPMDDADAVPVVEEMIHEVATGEPVVAVVAEKEHVIPLTDVDGNADVASDDLVVAAV